MDSAEVIPERVEDHGTLLSKTFCSVQSAFNFPSKGTTAKHTSENTGISIGNLPKILSNDNYLQFTPLSSRSHQTLLENGIFHSDSNLRCPESGAGTEQVAVTDLSPSLQPPPHSANGTPMCIKRGPGRPRKDGAPAAKCSNSLNKFKKFCSGGSYISGSMRGVRGRKKADSSNPPFLNSSGSLSELGLLEGDSSTFTEDTMESDSSSVASSFDRLLEDFTFFPEQWPGKLCAFCNLGEKSMSGQGDLIRCDIPPGFDPHALFKLFLESSLEKDNSDKSPKEVNSRRPKIVGKIKRLTSQGSLESVCEPLDEVVGYADDVDLNSLFDTCTGHYYIHTGCALWCKNVTKAERGFFANLEHELVRALGQRCSYCGNFGAGLACSVGYCTTLLHLPCAATSGSFQETSSYNVICSSHLDRAVALVGKSACCTVCDDYSNLSSMIMCSTCGHHYHTFCMELTSDPVMRAGWQCPACKMCQACRQPGDEGKLLACETCDKAYHIFCLRPALSSIPKHSWKCKMCRSCSDCGARTPGSGPSSRWHVNFSVCDSCYQQRNKGLACPLCGKAYRHVAQKLMVQCHLCKKYVHGTCDANADLSTYQQRKEIYPDYEYICMPCKAAGTGLNTSGCNPRVVSAIKKASDKEDFNSESNSLLSSNYALSQDSLVFMEEDSLAETESSIDLIWSEKTRISSVVTEEPITPVPQPLPTPKVSPPSIIPVPVGLILPPQPKKRNGVGRPKSTDKNSSSAGKGKKKGRIADLGRKRGPKPKMRGVFGAPGVGLQRPSSDAPKGEEEPGVENRLVLCSSKDEFVIQQDVCVMCGAFGNDLEGRLISCAQCGQCYHPFCVNVKVTKVILQKGWRCLDCTVCEGCGQRHDEARLILCDDCDISFHIYCMNPPLDYVPQGNWKCKWCAICQLCGSNDPGVNSTWHKNYTLCGPCNSLDSCSVCCNQYAENELIMQCQTCDRWLHGSCDVILTEEEAEKCADYGYQCVLCRPREVPPPHLLPPPPVLVKPPPKSPELLKSRSLTYYTLDGVTLSSSGMQHIRNFSLDQPKKKRKKTPNIADMEAGILAAIESVVSGGTENNFQCDDSSRFDDRGDDCDKGKDGKKRGRNLQKFGVGGFVVRLRGPRLKEDEMESESQNGNLELEKPKRKPVRRKTKNKLIECFPAYLQEAFFGKSLLEVPQFKDGETGGASEELEGDVETIPRLPINSTIRLSPEELKILEGVNGKKDPVTKVITKKESLSSGKGESKKGAQETSVVKIETPDHLRDMLPLPGDLLDNDLVNTIMNDEITKVPDGLDVLSVIDDGELGIDHTGDEVGHKDELTDFLSSIDTGLPSMDSKDVEDIFKGVLTDESHPASMFPINSGQGPSQTQHPPQTPAVPTIIPPGGMLTINSAAVAPAVQGSPSISRSTSLHNVPQSLASPLNFPPPSPYHSEYSNSPQFSPAFSEPPSPWPAQVEGEVETPGNYSQRSIFKWEVDEALGPSATISAVLYSNMNHQELKREYPIWNERAKQIAKIWRSLPTDKKAPYLQKARENRAASRMQKAQQIPLESKSSSVGTSSSSSEEGSRGAPPTPLSSEPPPKEDSPEIVTISETPPPPTSSASSSLTLSQPHRCFIVHINTSPIPSTPSYQGSSQTKPAKIIPTTPSGKEPLSTKHGEQSGKVSLADQQIRVLTPSEIMRTLPALSQETCGFPLLDQEKLVPSLPVKTPRGETQEERHWKQLQAYRQQQAQQQQLVLQEHRLQGDGKDLMGVNLSPKHPYSPGMPPVHRQLSGEMSQMSSMDNSRQPLQVTTTQNIVDGGLISPHLQSPNARQSFSNSGQQIRMRPPALEMPPPSPSSHYSAKPGIGQHSPLISRSPIYSRMPYMHSPRPSLSSPGESYGNSPMTPQPDPFAHPPSTPRPENEPVFSPNQDTYGHKSHNDQFMNTSPNEMEGSGPLSSPRSGVQGQETRQHLRDLLQRQQIKKLEQDHSSPGTGDITSPNSQRVMAPWSTDDWQKVSMEGSQGQKLCMGPTSPLQQGNQFRHPFLPPHISAGNPVVPPIVQGQGRQGRHEFRQMGPQSPLQPGQQVDPRMRVLFQQQQLHNQQQRVMSPQTPQGHHQRPGFSLPSQQQLMHQHQQQLNPGVGGFQVRTSLTYESMQSQRMCQIESSGQVQSSSMLAQQLGRPLHTGRPPQPPPNAQSGPMPCSSSQLISQSNIGVRVGAEVISSSEHQELPESVTAELEKLEEEQHGEGVVDPGELADLGMMDDDELLGMGADFNILEYADPELNIVVGGEKTNILDDNLDLEEEKDEEKEEKELKRKEEHVKHEKKESKNPPAKYGNHPISSQSSQEPSVGFPPSQGTIVTPKPEFVSQPTPPRDAQGTILRPPQPPPPYPGPPPPYPGPGRQQSVGIRNGGGLSLQPVSPVMNMGMILKNSAMGGGGVRRQPQQLPLLPAHPPTMSANQRRTLLLQEQPLLLEDLLEQEKREQQRQGPMIMNTSSEEPLLSDFDFERLKADVLSSNNLPPSLSPPAIPGQGLLPPQKPMYNRLQSASSIGSSIPLQHPHPPSSDWSTETQGGGGLMHRNSDHSHENSIGMHPAMSQVMPNNVSSAIRFQMPTLPAPPVPPEHPATEQERQMQIQYEQWLYHQQQMLELQQKYFDGEVNKLRKIKKSLNSKQRQLRKNGSELSENDAMELERVVKELSGIQKQFEQARKQARQHTTLYQDYKTKQQKRQQMLDMGQPLSGGPSQVVRQIMGPGHPSPTPKASPLANPNQSPHHATPHSPMLSPSPSMSPLTQHSPMASPMAPSPGPGSNPIIQTSPRGSLSGGMHHMDDRPFSPNNNDGMRTLSSPGTAILSQHNRMQQPGPQHRMGNMGNSSPQLMPQGNLGNNQHMLPNRAMGMNTGSHQQRSMTFVLGNPQQRMRPGNVPVPDQMRMHHSVQQRFQRMGMGQEMIMRGRMPMQSFQSSSTLQSIGKPPGPQHYNDAQRVPFPVQSPTGVGMNMRSPSPLTQIGSPPGNQVINQNRVSPASSPMRRPSGSGSVGIGSPLPDRPKSVENPLTPRSAGSGPHTPSSISGMTNMMEGISGGHPMEYGNHFGSPDGSMCGKDVPHHHPSYSIQNPASFNVPTSTHGEMGGGGGGSSQMIPYPTFSWFSDPNRLGLKGGSPFSVVNGEAHSATLHQEQTQSNEPGAELMQVSESGSGINASNVGGVNTMGSSPSAGTQAGESQNALLKQLLQNTGCASTSQPPSETTRFSLSTCLPPRTIANSSSHLSEAATRIPQPTSIPRPPETAPPPPHTPPPLARTTIKTEQSDGVISDGTQYIMMQNAIKIEDSMGTMKDPQLPLPSPDPLSFKEVSSKEINQKESPSFSSTLAETIDVVASDQTALDPSLYEARRADDEARKAKRRQYQAKRRQSMGKEQTPKKRARKGSKMEEDYEAYLDNLMSQLRQLPSVGITEPELGRNLNACGVPGMGDMCKIYTRKYDKNQGDLLGEIGESKIRDEPDYYNMRPFGTEELSESREKKSQPAQRGFYNQEFASPRLGIFSERENSRSRSPSPGRSCDTPDTIVSSSSPEPASYEKNNPYSSLKCLGVNEDITIRCSSPVYEILRPIPVRPVPPRFERGARKTDETDKENKKLPSEICFIKSRSGGPLKENGNVTVTLTLCTNAVDDIGGVLRNLANILCISSPSGYQILERSLTPPSQKYGLYTYRSKDGKEAVDIQSILNGAAKFCRHCDIVVLNNIIRKKPSDFPGVTLPAGKEENLDGSEDFYFCSSNCLMQFSMTHGITVTPEEKVSTQLRNCGFAKPNAHSITQAGAVVKHTSPVKASEVQENAKDPKLIKGKLTKVTNDILERSKLIERGAKPKIEPGEDGKKWKGVRYRYWSPNSQSLVKYKKPTEKELTELLFRMAITVTPPKISDDSRECLFCHQKGDSVSDGPARLVNVDVDKWVHLNCVLWSEEVYETENGALVNAEVALKQSLTLECIACAQKGATVKCFKVRCSSVYHLGCAVKEGCVFYKNKTVYCSAHIPKGEKDNELTTLSVFRRVYIQRDENRQVAAVMHHADQHHLLRVGSLIFLSVGQLLPHQLPTFHTRNYIYPIGYKIVRFYWSMFRVNKRCQYICSIHEVDGKPEFRITVEENGQELIIKSSSAQDAWHQVLDAVIKLRASADSIKVFPKFISGEDLFGLTEPAIVKVLESLPGVETLTDYHFKYGRNPLLELPLAINPTGCARSEPKLRTHFKRPHTQRTGSSSRSTYSAFTPMSSSDAACPYSKQFVHSKSSQYRKMKQDWRNNVYLARSKIQGLGLYAARDIEKHTMVIEYIGEIIRSELAELREKRYEIQNRGIYMFRVDENRVIDATLCGGLARYINHSCNPNCVAEQVEVERDIRIIIFTNRRICRGEELSYDYKFEFEDDQHKIPCLCGAPNCVQWMN